MSCVPNVPTQDLVVLLASRSQGSGSSFFGELVAHEELDIVYTTVTTAEQVSVEFAQALLILQ